MSATEKSEQADEYMRSLGLQNKANSAQPAVGLPTTFTLSQVSEALQVHGRTVRNLVARGLLRPIPGIRHLRFTAQEVNRFINNGKYTVN